MRPTTATRRVEQLLGVAVVSSAAVSGGDVATVTRLRVSDGSTVLVKTMAHPPAGMFPREAAGLRWLAEPTGGVQVPDVLAVADDVLVLRWVEPGRPTPDAAADLGRRLARTHAAGAPAYGAPDGAGDGWIAGLPLPQRTAPTWAEFYAVRRVLPYLRLARDRGAVDAAEAVSVEALVGRLTALVPEEGPARLHGDLWNGNVLWGTHGPRLIDPAAYAGHREADLAMLALFGLPHLPRVLEAYADLTPLSAGWEDRTALHQVHPLLVHACLFGGGYGARAARAARRYL